MRTPTRVRVVAATTLEQKGPSCIMYNDYAIKTYLILILIAVYVAFHIRIKFMILTENIILFLLLRDLFVIIEQKIFCPL